MKKLILLFFCSFFITNLPAQNKLLDSPSRKLQLAEFAISNLYVDKVDEDKLVETAIVSMLEELDPHSTYSDPEEVKRLNEPLQGNFDGIGIQFNMATDTLFVIQTFRESRYPGRRPHHRSERHGHCRREDEHRRSDAPLARTERLHGDGKSAACRCERVAALHHQSRQDSRIQFGCFVHGRRKNRLHPCEPLCRYHRTGVYRCPPQVAEKEKSATSV